jgi:hypothetical protein
VRRDLKIRGYTVGQFPNPPLWAAFGALLLSLVTDEGSTVNDVARAVLYVALAIWAFLEAASGVNRLRRALGAVVLVVIAIAVARAVV